jgi:hypothetical protein
MASSKSIGLSLTCVSPWPLKLYYLLLMHTLIPQKTLRIFRRRIQSLENILPRPNRLPPTHLPFFQARWQCLNHRIIIHRKEERHTIPRFHTPIHNAMHGRLVQPVRPAHQKVADVDDQRVGLVGRDVPFSRGLEDFEPRRGGGEQQSEAFVVGVCAKTDLFFAGGRGLLAFGWRVVEESRDAAWMRGHGVEICLWEIEREGKEAEEVACEAEDLVSSSVQLPSRVVLMHSRSHSNP